MMQAGRGAARPPIGVVLEGDLGHRLDALMSVAMLNGLVARGECRMVALSISRPSLITAQLADVVAGFYVPRPVGGSSLIGMPDGPSDDARAPLTAILARREADALVYTSNITSAIDTADNAVLMRNMLLAQHDGNAAIVVAGPATGALRLLRLFGARPQVEAKVARLVVALGAYGSGAPVDSSVRLDLPAARALFQEWPGEIVAVGTEVGEALPYPEASIARDFSWAPTHPIVDAYRVATATTPRAPTTALVATLCAVRAAGAPFELSEPGTIQVLDDGRTRFVAGGERRHRYVRVPASAVQTTLDAIVELVSARPAPRPGRRGAPPAAAAQPAAPVLPQVRP
jgi:hypothetical protein